MSSSGHGAASSSGGGGGILNGAGSILLVGTFILLIMFVFVGPDNASKIRDAGATRITNFATGESTGKPAVADDGLRIQYGGTISIGEGGIMPFYANGTVTLLNTVDYSTLDIAPEGVFIVTSSEDGRYNTITAKSGKPELVIITVVRTKKLGADEEFYIK